VASSGEADPNPNSRGSRSALAGETTAMSPISATTTGEPRASVLVPIPIAAAQSGRP
jgi:hypothetical protein